jgi:hypothetical protein
MKRIFTIAFLALAFFSAKAQNDDIINFDATMNKSNELLMQQWISTHSNDNPKQIITIPVVVHIVYANTPQNISDTRVLEQIDVLNACYNDTAPYAPIPYDTVAADCEIRFCLAQRTPDGDSTDGIERRQTTVSGFAYGTGMKYYSSGGLDVWDPTKYLNIWVCNLTGGLTGFAEFPTGTPSATDGLVMHYQYFGVTGSTSPYNEGKSTVHELAHWLNLYHICCSAYYLGCPDMDYCADTPPMNSDFFSCSPPPPPPEDSCTTNPIQGNYMQFADDECLTFFTNDQSDRMHACLNTLRPWLLTSNGCIPPTVDLSNSEKGINSVSVFPNPTEGLSSLKFNSSFPVKMNFKILDITGRTLLFFTQDFSAGSHEIHINTTNLKAGVYFIQMESEEFSSTLKLIEL